MPFDVPFILGPFIVDRTGRLTPDAGASPSFRITWRERVVHIRMRDIGDGLGSLAINLTLGRIPSTAPRAGPAARAGAFAIIRHLPPVLPVGWSMALLPDHRILLRAQAELALPASATSLISELTVVLLKLDPYLTLVDEAGLGLSAF